ncbi:hypothetical protein [Krasilnikovia cinnamomea]|nr:hypothetical protein [Krasilnikovia cinnamomea]
MIKRRRDDRGEHLVAAAQHPVTQDGGQALSSSHPLLQGPRWRNFDSGLRRWPEPLAGRRWQSWLVGGNAAGRLRAAAVVRKPGPGRLKSSALLTPAWDLLPADRDGLVVGSLLRQRGGLQLRPDNRPEQEHEAVRGILGRLAADHGAAPIAFPNVPADQVAAIASAFRGAVVRRAGTWSEYVLGGATSVEEFVGTLGRKVRALWRARRPHLESLGWRTTVSAPTEDLIERASELLADVNVRNGTPDAPRMAQARTTMWWQELPEAARAITVTDDDGALLAVCFARAGGDVLELQEVGIAAGALGNSDAYVLATVVAPLELAVAERIAIVSAGYGHANTKAMYGASLGLDYHIVADLGELTGA